jgi:HEAT repeat protein
MIARISLALVLVAALAWATGTDIHAQQPATTPETVTYQDIVKSLRTGKSEQEILDTLSKATVDVNFVLGDSQIQELQKMRVSDEFIGALRKLKTQPGVPGGDVTDFALILDCSGSMLEKTREGISKMDAAKKTVTELIQRIPNGLRLTFVIYGHDKRLECNAVKVVRSKTEVTDSEKAELTQFIAALQPSGNTPIARALRAAGKELADGSGLAEVALITDGVETCGGDPAQEAAELVSNLKLRSGVNVIGFGLKADEQKAIQKIAQAGRGKYYDAQTAAELRKGLGQVARVELQPEKAQSVDEGGVPPAVQALMGQLSDEEANVRYAAAESLGKMGARAKGAAPALVKRLADDLWGSPSTPVHQDNASGNTSKDAALKALKQIAPDQVVEGLTAALKSNNPKVRTWAATALAGDAGAKSPRRTESAVAESEPATSGDLPPAVKALVAQLSDEDANVRHAAAQSLGKMGAKAKGAVPGLMKRLADDLWGSADNSVHQDNATGNTSKDAALKALKQIAPEKVEEGLTAALKSKNAKVRSWAATALAGAEK